MTAINIIRTDKPMPVIGVVVEAIKDFLFGFIDGFTREDKRAWRRLWKRIKEMEAGEIIRIEAVMPRSGPYHRRHMAIEQAVFDAQERFQNFEMLRQWMKIGAGWVDWVPGAKGGIVPLPKSISYAAADQEEFTRYHEAVVEFLRGPHAARFLWKHLGEDGAAEMMDSILAGFEE